MKVVFRSEDVKTFAAERINAEMFESFVQYEVGERG